MKKSLVALTGMLLFGASGLVFAQTCAAPLPIQSNSSKTGDLCAAPNSLPTYGGITSPQNEVIYSFVADGANATIGFDDATGFTGVLYLMPSPCAPGTDPIAIGNSVGTDMPVSGLTDGSEYFVIVTANPGGPEDACGTFGITVNGTLPVELQNFSAE